MRYRDGDFSLEPQGMELRHIQHAIALATTGSFTKAAELEAVSARVVAASVKRLERYLQIQLFNETDAGVVPTAAGRMFLLRGKGILEACSLLQRSIVRYVEKARSEVMPKRIVGPGGEAKEPAGRQGATGATPLFVLCVGPEHQLARQASVPLAKLSNETFIAVRQGDSLCDGAKLLVRHEIKPRVTYETQGRARALELIRANVGVGVLATPVRTDGIIQIPFEERELSSVHTLQ